MKAQSKLNIRSLSLALFIGLVVGILRVWLAREIRPLLGNGGGDFSFATRIAHDLWAGRDPYDYPVLPDSVPYPLPAGLVAMPYAVFEDEVASGVFMGLSSSILAWCMLGKKKTWPLLVFLSWPFAYAVLFSQWTPIIMCIWYLPILLPLILVKPHIAFPLVVTGKFSKGGLILAFLLGIISLVIQPDWPLAWFEKTGTYKGLPLLLSLPLGPVILLAILKYRDKRAWLMILLALMPQRVLYDQLPLLLIATNEFELIFLVFLSWITLPVLFKYGGWANVPINWQFWIVLTLYLPALPVLFREEIVKWFKKFTHRRIVATSSAKIS